MTAFINDLNTKICEQNYSYRDLIKGKVLQTLRIKKLTRGCFSKYLNVGEKFGGQHKIQRISNDRSFTDRLLNFDSL